MSGDLHVTDVVQRGEEIQFRRVKADITGAPPRPTYPGSGRRWRPEKITGTWERHRVDGARWSPWSFSGALSGPTVKPDGSVGRARHRCSLHDHLQEPGLSRWLASTRPPAAIPDEART